MTQCVLKVGYANLLTSIGRINGILEVSAVNNPMVRDEELKRLIKYAQGMGVSVCFKPYIRYSLIVARWETDGSGITIFTSPSDSKLDKVLSLIHELGHHKGFIENNRQKDPKVEAALDDEEEKRENRRTILVDEIKDTKHWEQIYKDTDCKFNIKKLYIQKEFDIWCYRVYYQTGKRPNKAARITKRKQLRKKYKTK